MSEFATRGQLAFFLFKALGLTEVTSTGTFGDSGPYLDGITSTLADLGITNGVGGGQFGTMTQTTRGQAFTMIARALGLADSNTSIENASAALVASGIVKGYGNDPTNIGINDPLEMEHLQLLVKRIAPILAGTKEARTAEADDIREDERARTDPAYAAFLAKQGVRLGNIDDEIALRQELFNQDALRRTDAYGRATDAAIEGVQTDFENRGLFLSGTRLQREADKRQDIGFEQEAAIFAAQRAKNIADRETEGRRSVFMEEEATALLAHETEQGVTQVESQYP